MIAGNANSAPSRGFSGMNLRIGEVASLPRERQLCSIPHVQRMNLRIGDVAPAFPGAPISELAFNIDLKGHGTPVPVLTTNRNEVEAPELQSGERAFRPAENDFAHTRASAPVRSAPPPDSVATLATHSRQRIAAGATCVIPKQSEGSAFSFFFGAYVAAPAPPRFDRGPSRAPFASP